jgi:hypothetical protein
MRTFALLVCVLVLAGCTRKADSGPITSMSDLVSWVQERTDSCDNPQPGSLDDFAAFVGPQLAELYVPYTAEWTTCSVSSSYPKVGLVLLSDQRAFEQSWRDAMTAGKVSDGPSFSFGEGFAITSGFLGVSQLDLYYLRCHYSDPQVYQVPAHVEDCVFANPEHHHHG